MSPMLHLFWRFYWANRVDFKFPGLHWSTVNGDRWLLRLSRKATPMLCFAHGGSEGCEQQNREQGTHCPKCSNDGFEVIASEHGSQGAVSRRLKGLVSR